LAKAMHHVKTILKQSSSQNMIPLMT
jgi:hypothetical protein